MKGMTQTSHSERIDSIMNGSLLISGLIKHERWSGKSEALVWRLLEMSEMHKHHTVYKDTD